LKILPMETKLGIT